MSNAKLTGGLAGRGIYGMAVQSQQTFIDIPLEIDWQKRAAPAYSSGIV